MRQRRSERFAGKHLDKAIMDLLAENTYGGGKDKSKSVKRQMPVIASIDGIKVGWDNRYDEYPSTVSLRMSDGEWITYRLFVEQPGLTPAQARGLLMKRS